MRLSFAVPTLAGLLLGWAAVAQADAPPAAPIFYCPTPGKADPAPAATTAKPAAQAAHVVHAGGRRHQGCPTMHVAVERHRWHGRGGPRLVAGQDVSASQAFIYRYERAMHGLDPRAAEEAWAEGRHAPCPHHCPDRDGWRHDGPDRDHDLARNAPVPRVDERPLPPPLPPLPPSPPPVHAYAWQDGDSGYRADERDQERQRVGGWSYREVDGRGRYQHWGDRFDGEPGGDGRHDEDGDHDRDHRWAEGPHRCPPPVPASACTAGQSPAPHHADVAVAGRDAAGYLTWPGKTEQ
jgi:hypothetical protein